MLAVIVPEREQRQTRQREIPVGKRHFHRLGKVAQESRISLASCAVCRRVAGLRRLLCYFLGIGPQPESQINDAIPLGNKVAPGQLAEHCVEMLGPLAGKCVEIIGIAH